MSLFFEWFDKLDVPGFGGVIIFILYRIMMRVEKLESSMSKSHAAMAQQIAVQGAEFVAHVAADHKDNQRIDGRLKSIDEKITTLALRSAN